MPENAAAETVRRVDTMLLPPADAQPQSPFADLLFDRAVAAPAVGPVTCRVIVRREPDVRGPTVDRTSQPPVASAAHDERRTPNPASHSMEFAGADIDMLASKVISVMRRRERLERESRGLL